MLSFYEMLQLVENRPTKIIQGTADDMINSRQPSHLQSAKGGKGLSLRQGDIEDIGKHRERELDDPGPRTYYYGQHPDADQTFASGAAVRADGRPAFAHQLDMTSTGKQDVPERPNPTKPSLKVGAQTVGYDMGATQDWLSKIEKAQAKVKEMKNAFAEYSPELYMKELQSFSDLLNQASSTPSIHPKLIDRINKLQTIAQNKLSGNKTQGIPAQDDPKRSPMAKYMDRKHSKVF